MNNKKGATLPKEAQEVTLNQKNQDTIKGLINQRAHIDKLLNEVTTVILDAKDIEYQGKQVSFNDDFTKIIIK